MSAWRQHSGFLAWPSVLLTLAVYVGFLVVWGTALVGVLPLWLGSPLVLVLIYLAFTPMHEAAHGNVGGSPHRAWVDLLTGWACSLLFLAPFPAFKAVHLRHHGAVNKEHRDPDLWVAGTGPLSIAARCLSIIPHYYRMFLGSMACKANRWARVQSVIAFALTAGLMVALLRAGLGVELFMLWLLPAWVASGLLALAFDWLPHQPHRELGRWNNARVILGPSLSVLMLGQNYHLVHHLWPRVPFYRYRHVFEASRLELEENGARIVEAEMLFGIVSSHT
ncbi:MAG: fatty acid desaturase [Cognaticolwellia sp.]